MFSVESMVRGYHVYRRVWEASVGEELTCQRNRGNLVNPFAVRRNFTASSASFTGAGFNWQFTSAGLKKRCNAITVERQNDCKAPRVKLGNHVGNFRIGFIFVWLLVVWIIPQIQYLSLVKGFYNSLINCTGLLSLVVARLLLFWLRRNVHAS